MLVYRAVFAHVRRHCLHRSKLNFSRVVLFEADDTNVCKETTVAIVICRQDNDYKGKATTNTRTSSTTTAAIIGLIQRSHILSLFPVQVCSRFLVN